MELCCEWHIRGFSTLQVFPTPKKCLRPPKHRHPAKNMWNDFLYRGPCHNVEIKRTKGLDIPSLDCLRLYETRLLTDLISLLVTRKLPLISLPLIIPGFILSIRGRVSSQRKFAIAAWIMCVLSLTFYLVMGIGMILLGLAGGP